MTGSYFRGDAMAVLRPEDEARFKPVVYTYYERLNGDQYLKSLDIGYWFYTGTCTARKQRQSASPQVQSRGRRLRHNESLAASAH